MRSYSSLPTLGRTARTLFGVAAAVVVLVLLFDWNWFRRPLVSYLEERSGREIRVDDLDVDVGFSLTPTVHLRGVYVKNAAWAGEQPFATAGEASFTVSLKSVWEGRPVILRLVLVDAEVDMQRQADGLRNWRLREPEDRGPGKVTVHTLEAHRTQIRFINRAIDLDLTAAASAVDKGEEGLSTRIAYKGTYKGAPFSGEALNAGIISFRDSGVTFPLRGYMVTRKTRVEVDGLFTDIYDLGPFDTKIRLKGATLEHLHPFLPLHPPASRPFELEAYLTQTHDVYELTGLTGKIGATDISGAATLDRSGERMRVRVDLHSESAEVADLRPLAGLQSAARIPADGRVFPARALRVDALRGFDAHVTMNAKKLTVPDARMLESLRLTARLDGGVLQLEPVSLGMAGGHAIAALTFDARGETPSARATIELRALRLERLIPSLAQKARAAGAIRGELSLAGKGHSIAAMFGGASGSMSAHLDEGRISNLADAKLGFNPGKVMGLWLRGDRDIAINCAVMALDVRAGVGKSRAIVLDTQQTRVEGAGSVNLREERWELILTPRPKKPGLLTKSGSIRVQGTFTRAETSMEERAPIERAAAPADDNGLPINRPCPA